MFFPDDGIGLIAFQFKIKPARISVSICNNISNVMHCSIGKRKNAIFFYCRINGQTVVGIQLGTYQPAFLFLKIAVVDEAVYVA